MGYFGAKPLTVVHYVWFVFFLLRRLYLCLFRAKGTLAFASLTITGVVYLIWIWDAIPVIPSMCEACYLLHLPVSIGSKDSGGEVSLPILWQTMSLSWQVPSNVLCQQWAKAWRITWDAARIWREARAPQNKKYGMTTSTLSSVSKWSQVGPSQPTCAQDGLWACYVFSKFLTCVAGDGVGEDSSKILPWGQIRKMA